MSTASDPLPFADTVPEPPQARLRGRRCPACGSAVKRILRTANDRRRWDVDDWRRYRCRRCDWQGLMRVSSRKRLAAQGEPGTPVLVRVGQVALLLALCGLLTWAAISALQSITGV